MISEVVIPVPNVLKGTPEVAEKFLSRISMVQPTCRVILDLSDVTWICPYGTVLLLGVCRYLAQLGGGMVLVTAIQENVHAYLRRVDFFKCAVGVASTSELFDEANDWSRSESSSTVLELVPISTSSDVYQVKNRARKILGHWLNNASYDIDQIISLLAEACSNVVDHSGDIGVVTIQKYKQERYVDIQLAISDLGVGIRRSLITTHHDLSDTSAGYIKQALDGLSARPDGRGGQGLGAIQRIATKSGGSLSLRSETGWVLVQATGQTERDSLTFFPGTQVAVTFRSWI